MTTPAKRLYYGWVIVAIGCGTMLLVQGAFASSGVLFAALTQELEPCRHLAPLFRGPGRVYLPHLALRPLIRPLRTTPVVPARGAVSGARLNPQRAGAHALAAVSDLGRAGRIGPEPDRCCPEPGADVVVVPLAMRSCLRAGAQWCQHGHVDLRTRTAVCGAWLRLATGLYGARTPRVGIAHASHRPLAASSPRCSRPPPR